MKKITKKSILQKITISILSIMLLFNFIVPTYSHAGLGGILTDPIFDFVALLGDTIIGLVQGAMNLSVGEEFSASNNAYMVDVENFNTDSKYADFKKTGDSKIKRTIDTSELNLGWSGTSYQVPLSRLSPEEIFGGKVAALDINFISPDKATWGTTTDSEGEEIVASSAGQLQKTIASWYIALRNLSLVGLLSILVYIGIRIILSSNSNDKAKYKQMLTDWLIALCLLFFMHYIMSFIITMTESITTAILGSSNGNIAVTVNSSNNAASTAFTTNLMGFARFQIQKNTILEKFTYLIIYGFLLYYTIMFTWKYLKRMVMMAFLTIIAPLVVLTYPIDKISDGKAQAFDSWLKEYTFNALLQPFHLIIYYVFVLSAMDLATNNILYTIVVLWFIPKAEEILRKFFGFDKAPSLGSTMAGFAGGLGLSKLMSGKGGSKGKTSGGNSSNEGNKPPRFNKGTNVNELPEGSDNSTTQQEPEDDNQETDNPYEQPNYGEQEEQLSPEEMAEQDPNYMYMHPELFDDRNSQTPESAQQGQQANQEQDESEQQSGDDKTKEKKPSKIKNWVRGHGGALNMTKRTLKGAARLATGTAFTLGGGMAGAILGAAQGKGISGMVLGATAGGKLGRSATDPFINIAGKAAGMAIKPVKAGVRVGKGIKQHSFTPVWQGTMVGKELDLANGNTRYQDAASSKEIKTNKDNVQYVRDYLTDKNGGRAPTNKEIKAQMNSLDPYIEKGFNDIKDMIKSQKAAQKLGLSDSQAAIIAAIGKKNNITPERLNDDKKAQADRDNLVYQLQGAGNSKENAEKRADLAMNYLKEKEGVKNSSRK